MKIFKYIILYLFLIHILNCNEKRVKVDLIIKNALIYTVDEFFSMADCLAVKDGKFVAVGKQKEILLKYRSGQIIDLEGRPVYPGYIDGHCHFHGLGSKLIKYADLQGTSSFEEILEILKAHEKKYPDDWLVGIGWDQNDWEIKEFPDNAALDSLFPNKSVMIIRIDGHAVLANSMALQKAKIHTRSQIQGSEIVVKNGKLTGILIDNAADSMKNVYKNSSFHNIEAALLEADKKCYAVGLTSVTDAGLSYNIIRMIDSLQQLGLLKIKINAMINPSTDNIMNYMEKGPFQTERLHVGAIKLYADGALGSRGALLLKPYNDKPDYYGILVNDTATIKKYCEQAYRCNYQVCTHAIGDSAVRLMLDIYIAFLKGPNDLRWRIEHAQVVDKDDFARFGEYSIIPSIQASHATSDMYWAKERLGDERIKNAYAYKKLLQENGWIINGTDFPIEYINPVYSFYAAVSRKDIKGWTNGGFQVENALSREEALKAMTIWAAKGSFEEKDKGSIEPGKWADFVVLDNDIMTTDEKLIPQVKVLRTFISGEEVYNAISY